MTEQSKPTPRQIGQNYALEGIMFSEFGRRPCRGAERAITEISSSTAATAESPKAKRNAERSKTPRRFLFTRIVAAGAAIAAVIVLAVVLNLDDVPLAEKIYGSDEVEIFRTGVALTIMSKPEGWGEYAPTTNQQKASYRSNNSWPGLALVRDQRIIRKINKGLTSVKFTDIPSGIKPNSVRLTCMDAPGKLKILEQNYQYDLASTPAIFDKYIDKTIHLNMKDKKIVSGKLLSYDTTKFWNWRYEQIDYRVHSLTIQPASQGPRNVDINAIDSVNFDKLPEGLLTRPTLVWELDNSGPTKQQFEVAYLTHGLNWHADYTLKLRPSKQTKIQKSKNGTIDTADLVGYATIMNNSGVTYKNAQLKLMAGDVNIIKPEGMDLNEYDELCDVNKAISNLSSREGFTEKSFFEYHLYTLGQPTTISDSETKQIELISGSGLKLKRGYVYDPDQNATASRVTSELENSKENGLGIPLPKGVVRLYAPDPDGEDTFVSQTEIDHTPKNEKLRFYWGYAFDIVCEFEETHVIRHTDNTHATNEYTLRNHKDNDVTITIIARVPKSTFSAKCNIDGKDYPWHVRQVGVVEIDVQVKANSQQKIKFLYDYNRDKGGGLKSPHDELE